ncbi:MAG: hypothetical protein LWX70_09045 [Sphingobacteriia bacterium]|nr:hypothetical protein [Sphingobacteriia bacterium]
MPDTSYQMSVPVAKLSVARCQMPDASCQMPDARCQMLVDHLNHERHENG